MSCLKTLARFILWIIAFSPNLSIKKVLFCLFIIDSFIALQLYAAAREGQTKKYKKKKKSVRLHGIF